MQEQKSGKGEQCLLGRDFFFFNHTASVTPQGAGSVSTGAGNIGSHYQDRNECMDQMTTVTER